MDVESIPRPSRRGSPAPTAHVVQSQPSPRRYPSCWCGRPGDLWNECLAVVWPLVAWYVQSSAHSVVMAQFSSVEREDKLVDLWCESDPQRRIHYKTHVRKYCMPDRRWEQVGESLGTWNFWITCSLSENNKYSSIINNTNAFFSICYY